MPLLRRFYPLFTGLLLAGVGAIAQNPGAFPARPKADPQTVERGKRTYSTNCAYCHGQDARGGENGGTNILRSELTLKDRNGEELGPFLRENALASHKFNLTAGDAADIAAFLHNFGMNSRDPGRMRPPTVVVGDGKAGEVYFKANCSACHSATGDLKGLATRIADPRDLQQTWLMPVVLRGRGLVRQGTKPMTATVTTADGRKAEGRLLKLDDFVVAIQLSDGTERTFRRDDNVPRVEVHDPMKEHKALLAKYTDADIHNLTAYLVTLK